ncbi:MAG TPA: hypothetical protein PLU22_02275, partial [Polyangiaceae bacterium]|nr:hypothetical protein [Polyangiaceae bacterium]
MARRRFETRAILTVGLAALLAAAGCGQLLGVGDYEVVSGGDASGGGGAAGGEDAGGEAGGGTEGIGGAEGGSAGEDVGD